MEGKGERRRRKWVGGWMDGWTGVCKQFGMATLDEPIICQSLSEYERKGNMDGKWLVCWQQSLTQQHSHKT